MKTQIPNKQRGLSLIELLISMALGLVLLLGAMEIFVRSSQTYRMQDAIAEMQENARFALNLLMTDMRMSGYLGCSNLIKVTPAIAPSTGLPNYVSTDVLKGYQNTGGQAWNPTPPTSITDSDNAVAAAADSDIIAIMSAGNCASALTTDMADGNSSIDINAANTCGFAAQDIAIVSDCDSAEVLRLTNTPIDGKFTHSPTTLNNTYSTTAELMNVKSVSYFIADEPTSGIPTLYMFNNSAALSADNPIALFEGIENMQILYGEDVSNNGTPDTLKDAHNVISWERVISAQITLLMRSSRNLNADPYTLNIGGTNVTYNDGVLRKPFSVTVQLRNRG